SSTDTGRFTIVTRPPQTPGLSLPWTTDSRHALIVDPKLAEQLNEVVFFYTSLATAPTKVILPGKSLRAALESPEAAHALGSGSRTDRTSDASCKSGGDCAARQLARLKRLYADLHTPHCKRDHAFRPALAISQS
ncbi:hypothetical protein EW145_g979, partial [Phellinidium pouzarii]